MLINSRLLVVLLLGFSSGLPLALTGTTLQAWFTESGVSLLTIGSLSLIGLPYTFKFLWAPIMDHYRLPRLGQHQGWALVTQIGLVISLLFMANMNPVTQASSIWMVALVVAFFSASQDVAVDAYRTDILAQDERGLGASYHVFAYRVAMLVSGGLALIMAAYIGWKMTYYFMALLMMLSMVVVYSAPKPAETHAVATNLAGTTLAALRDLWQRDNIVMLLGFIVLYKLGDSLALQLMMNFLLHGLGFTLIEVGLAYKVVAFVATIIGAFIGGILLMRWNIYRALLVFGLAQAFSNLTFVALAMLAKNFALMAGSIFIENFCSGLSTAALLALMMSLCHRRYTASQFALLSACTSLGRVLLGPLASVMVAQFGWAEFFFIAFLLCFPGILFLIWLKPEVSSYAHALSD